MASLAAQDCYLQGLARRAGVRHSPERPQPRKRKPVSKPGQAGNGSRPPQKKRRRSKKQDERTNAPPAKQAASNANKLAPEQKAAPQANKSAPPGVTQNKNKSSDTGGKSELNSTSFSAINLLRQRLHEKIKEASGRDDDKELSPSVLEKRRRRKYEKERKKRRRKELKMKAKMEKKETEDVPVEPQSKKEESTAEIVFNRVEVHEENDLNKVQKKKEKRKGVKGKITPLTGRNYKQLLSRLEARKNKLEELKDKDQKKAQELENKIKWTNLLYKAEGVKIRDDEERLKEALKRKEKRKEQRQKQWEKRTEKVVERMQQRQEKRRKNIQKKKKEKIEHKKAKARKKGRVLPEDLKKAGL
ncbi:surfeit locus protein 6 [Aythya fuligula]|uniref:Surfeit locus protein 6 n=1 Tax=Aythya fuligula TaxID=219594 RepID=A0A6J3E2K7_AYTFU|nr:surfeit locus protein 6 [Aythya fuligula]